MIENNDTAELSIPSNTVFSGNIVTQSNARINGTVEGNVTSQNGNILFGMGSKVKGNVSGSDIAVGGGVDGDINAEGQLSIFSGAYVKGNINAISLLIEKDAEFDGHVTIAPREQIRYTLPVDKKAKGEVPVAE